MGLFLFFGSALCINMQTLSPAIGIKNHFQMCPYFHDDKHVDIDS